MYIFAEGDLYVEKMVEKTTEHVVYSSEVIELLHALDQEKCSVENYHPWLIVASFVNPHDIAIYGDISASSPFFRFHVDKSVPAVAPAPTQHELFATKPRCQASYREVYPQAFQPISDQAHYRRLYYQLQKNADREVMRVLEALLASSFYPETLVVFTSDHGELLGAHGNLHQKWYCAYEEAIHVPLINPQPVSFSTRNLHRAVNQSCGYSSDTTRYGRSRHRQAW
ncbi:sulfatase-like hydrolase/transferase [Brevibacillus formosus]|uniref:sulfatase-like hydrolase/transferase n=1 Tax=Brevibacillus formosus TaxID=54913 RepID=UPI001EEEA753|nr:sulfatase-like hydrolase/transferase [Brevibacillus formosus]